ncbi:SUMF1/EgtB/PvdO family nonheme iron enzyme [Breoghania sp.]|uniref:formylglycine-generating enzyme family protein n=1 Tax=Breoghania sp. TaxID=2065378 RepID=UPI002AA77EFD|nr:SUMF1/EgtB/PvdO family nonheme iron enzyme [Breoghania sp.]
METPNKIPVADRHFTGNTTPISDTNRLSQAKRRKRFICKRHIVEPPVLDYENLNEAMVALPEGSIILRDDRLGKSWSVDIKPVSICRYQVTRRLYSQVTGAAHASSGPDDHPIDTISWLDAAKFCNRLSAMFDLPDHYVFSSDGQDATPRTTSNGFRLPCEAEWEFACRAGTQGPRYGPIGEIAWYRENSGGGPRPVGTRRPNNWGLHDMLGNVWEWCQDIYDPAVYGTYRIFRGGGWADNERGCLATNRRRSHPTFAIDDLGFRLARSAI